MARNIDFLSLPDDPSHSTMFIIQDENGDIFRLAIYKEGMDPNYICSKYPFMCNIRINNPYMRLAMDGYPMIRVDDPKTVEVEVEKGVDLSKYCRRCFKPNSRMYCSKCKMAYYCSKECQEEDWKLLNHNLVCE